jgi:virginiamycin B lyase
MAIFMALCGLCAGLAGRGAAAIVEFPLLSVTALPRGITCGPDGAYWFVEYGEARIGRVDTNGVVTEYVIPSGNCGPYSIVTGPDGNLWFSETLLSQVGRIGTNGVIQEFRLPFTVVGTGITVGPDGRLWLADFGTEYVPGALTNGGIVAITLSNSVAAGVSYYNSNMTVHSRPTGITTGPDGNIYFTEQFAGKIGRITTNGVITEAPVTPTNTQPVSITTGPDGALWFTQANSNGLGRIDTSNFTNVTQFGLPANNTAGAVPDELNGLVLGRDGNLYYTDPPAGIVGQVGVSGTNFTVAQFYTPTTNAQPWMLATGPDRNIWFGEYLGNTIGKFFLPVPLSIQFTNNDILLSWTTNDGTIFMLQENSGFNPTNWVPVTNVPTTNGGNFVVTLPATNGPPTNSLFFRLID